jgi:hypothetical protein
MRAGVRKLAPALGLALALGVVVPLGRTPILRVLRGQVSDNGHDPTALAAGGAISVASFGALGDCAHCTASTLSNRTSVKLSATVSAADIGKSIEIFSDGLFSTDFLGTIVAVAPPNGVTLSAPCGFGLTNALCSYGTDNGPAFQAAINAAANLDGRIAIPPGRYLLVTNSISGQNAALFLPAMSLTLVGAGPRNSVLEGQGVRQAVGGRTYRGTMFVANRPATNVSYTFEGIAFDGGVSKAWSNGSWSTRHHLVREAFFLNCGPLYWSWRKCRFSHWCSEMFYGAGQNLGKWTFRECVFEDGNANGYNVPCPAEISHCVFNEVYQPFEWFAGYTAGRLAFTDNHLTNCCQLRMSGWSLTNIAASVLIARNTFNVGVGTRLNNHHSIDAEIGCNIDVLNNRFYSASYTSFSAVWISGNAMPGGVISTNLNWRIEGNLFYNFRQPITVRGPIDGLSIRGNRFVAPDTTVLGIYNGSRYWFTNASFVSNTAHCSRFGFYWRNPEPPPLALDNAVPPSLAHFTANNQRMTLVAQPATRLCQYNIYTNDQFILPTNVPPAGSEMRLIGLQRPGDADLPVGIRRGPAVSLGAPTRWLHNGDQLVLVSTGHGWIEKSYSAVHASATSALTGQPTNAAAAGGRR